MKANKKIIALFLAVMMMAALAACGSSGNNTPAESGSSAGAPAATSEEAAPEEETSGLETTEGTDVSELIGQTTDKTITIAVAADPTTLTPYGGGGEQRNISLQVLYQNLVYVNLEGEWEYVLAKDVVSKGDGVYDIELYDYIYDTNGNNMTASDVCFSYDKGSITGNYTTAIGYMSNYEAIDEYTVEITIENEKLGMLEAIFQVPIITEAGWEQSGDEMALNPVGTSPYKLVDYEAGSYYTYERTDNYWQTDESAITTTELANPKDITIKIITDKSTSAIALENGEIDAANSLNSIDYVNFVDPNGNALEGYTTFIKPNNTISYFVFNCSSDSPCQDINLRKAICYAIDTDAIVYSVFGQFGSQCTNFTNAAWTDSDPALNTGDYFNYDVDLAKEYLEQSNYNGEVLKILVLPEQTMQDSAVLMQGYLAEIGIQVELINLEGPTWQAICDGEDSTAYDINYYLNATNNYSWRCFKMFSETNYTNGLSNNFILDETFEDLYRNAGNMEYGTTGEGADAMIEYINENVYGYGIWYYYDLFVANDSVQTLVVSPSSVIVPGACVMAE